MVLIYCYDAWCGWCFGFSKVMQEIDKQYKNTMTIEVLSGGMILPASPTPISVTAPYIKEAYKTVEGYTGVQFGEDYLWHINNPEQSDWFPNSEKAAIALCIVKNIHPNKGVAFAADLQQALHVEGRDLTDDEAYRHLLEKYDIDSDYFYNQLHSQSIKEQAYQEFELVKKLQVTSFPQLILQGNDGKFYRIAQGYTDFDTVNTRLQSLLQELKP
jgi:putative protein-disulfide isomerase